MEKQFVMIHGSAGTGKSHRLAELVAQLVNNGVGVEEIAFISFTKKGTYRGVELIRQRLRNKEIPNSAFKYFKTIHGICYHLLGLSSSEVITTTDKRDLARTLDKSDVEIFKDTVNDALIREGRSSFDGFGDVSVSENFSEIYAAWKSCAGKTDFSDMLQLVVDKGLSIPDVRFVFIDEVQDITATQWKVIMTLFVNAQMITLGGDINQLIYGWAGATPEFLNSIVNDIPPEYHQTLDTSYRCGQRILDASNKFISMYTNAEHLARNSATGNGLIFVEQNELNKDYLVDVPTIDAVLNLQWVKFNAQKKYRELYEWAKDEDKETAIQGYAEYLKDNAIDTDMIRTEKDLYREPTTFWMARNHRAYYSMFVTFLARKGVPFAVYESGQLRPFLNKHEQGKLQFLYRCLTDDEAYNAVFVNKDKCPRDEREYFPLKQWYKKLLKEDIVLQHLTDRRIIIKHISDSIIADKGIDFARNDRPALRAILARTAWETGKIMMAPELNTVATPFSLKGGEADHVVFDGSLTYFDNKAIQQYLPIRDQIIKCTYVSITRARELVVIASRASHELNPMLEGICSV